MTLSRWQPFQELSTIRKQMDRLFEDMLSSGDKDWLGLHGVGGMWTPAIELKETDKKLVLKAEIPGIDTKDLTVEVREDQVRITGEHKEEEKIEDREKNYFRSEFYYGKFERVIPLPMLIKTDAIKSEFKHGILTLTMPKVETTAKKAVKVNLQAS
jgi:HSP20 family protein